MSTVTTTQAEQGELLVTEYLRTGSVSIKERIIKSYAPMIKHIVGRFNVRYSTTLSTDDLYQYGVLGLLKALDRFDPALNVPFKSYVYRRIHGEVVDALRREGVLGRDMYEKVKRVENMVRTLSAQLAREPSAAEICDALKINEEEYHSIMGIAQMTYTTSLNTPVKDEEGGMVYRIDMLQDNAQLNPEQQTEQENLKKRMREVVQALPERERLILALYYYEELTLADIGQILELSEARISQILNKTLLNIRSEM
ncbi:MAG: FliA/WhiG family RNA polymerase sigma factor [Calditrichaeota bacterium]|nr:MAG: FliA/WhiG family RNA polymerase sigma factor [Calditrichota bacterium]